MATPQQINDLVGLYVAYFDRAPDPEGLQFWITQLDNGRPFNTIAQDFANSSEAREIYPFLATPDIVLNSSEAFITSIYANLFGRAPDQDGLDFWTLAINSGAVAPGDMVEAIMLGAQDTLVNGQLIQDKTIVANKIECALMWTENVAVIEGFEFDAEAYAAARASIDGVGADQASVDAAKLVTQQYINEFATVSNFALQQATMDVVVMGDDTGSAVSVDTLMWGTPPTFDDNGVMTTPGQGIPISEFFAPGGYFSLIAGQAFAGVAEIEVDEDMFSIIDFSSVDTISLTGTTNITGNAGDGSPTTGAGGQSDINTGDVGGVITFTYTDGSSDDIALGEAYYTLLADLMLVGGVNDNTRFFTQTTAAQLPVYVTADGGTTTVASEGIGEAVGYVNASLVVPGAETVVTIDVPLILTTTANNGSTTFPGFTSADNDVVTVSHLGLLHAAQLDGGLGQNTLEIDAKGHFAQPISLLNFQTINIQNLPNIYGDSQFDEVLADGTLQLIDGYPNYLSPTTAIGEILSNSIIDLSRATALSELTITEGDYNGLNTSVVEGGLNVTGIRNGAEVTIDGSFDNWLSLNFSGASGNGTDIVLNNANLTGPMFISDSSPKLNIESTGGGNYISALNATNGTASVDGESLTDLIVTGDARLFIDSDLSSVFLDGTPAVIDASGNTAGVDLQLSDVEFLTFMGSLGDDRLAASAFDQDTTMLGATDFSLASLNDADFGIESEITINNTNGDNWYALAAKEVVLTDGDGNNTVKIDAAAATATLGNGDNQFGADISELDLTVGDGDNHIEVIASDNANGFLLTSQEFNKAIAITAGDGENTVLVDVTTSDAQAADVDITAGNGGNTVSVMQSTGSATQTTVNVTTGTGSDTITAEGSEINITSGGGNDDITIVGTDNDYASDSVDIEADESGVSADGNDVISLAFNDGVLLNIDTGAGSATITLGVEGEDENGLASSNVIAKEGSVITGTDITLNVNTYANLIAADVSGVTSVVLDDDAGNRADSAQANDLYNGERAQLTVTMDQFLAIGADNMSVEGAIFNTQAFVKIIVTESTSLAALGVNDLPRNIDLYIEIADGATLTMTAEELHTRIARDGITLADDGNTDLANGNVVITGGGINFDPFNSNDTVQTNINGQVYFGGSISTNDFSDGNGNYVNVTVQSVFGPAGYNRPSDVISEVVLTIDSDSTPVVDGFDTFHSNVEIVGDADITFTDAINLGLFQGNSANLFTIDFSELGGQATGLTIGNFETVEQVIGNGIPGTEVFVEISADADDNGSGLIGFDDDGGTNAVDDRALISSGVSQYTVTVIGNNAGGDTATIRLCDKTEDLEVLAFRGNYNDTLQILDAAWGLTFELQGGGTRKAEGPTAYANIGTLNASFEWNGAPAVVNIVHSVAGDTRPLYVEGLTIANATSIEVNADGPAAIIENFEPNSATTLTFNANGDLSLVDNDISDDSDADSNSPIIDVNGSSTITIDASGVVGEFTASVDGEYVAATSGSSASGGGDFTFTGAQGSSNLTLINVDDDAAGGVTIDGGVGGVALTISGGVDLDESTLTNVTSVEITNGATLRIQMEDADEIGAANFSEPEGENGFLELVGLGGQEFALANYNGIEVTLVSIVDEPVVTLHPNTDLTNVPELEVPAGTTLNLTAAQFQQLNSAGVIKGLDGTTDFTISITGLTQADVDAGFDISDIAADTVTIDMLESIEMPANGGFTVNAAVDQLSITMGDDMTLTVNTFAEMDGVNVTGGVNNSVLKFVDPAIATDGSDSIDASGFAISEVQFLNLIANAINVDEALFVNIPSSVEKVIYNGEGTATPVTQTASIEPGTTTEGGLTFNKSGVDQDTIEISEFTLNLEGGSQLSGDLNLSTVQKINDFSADDLLAFGLQSLVINSTGTEENLQSGETTNVIEGLVTPAGATDDGTGTINNTLLNVTVNASQALEMGGIVFSAWGSGALTVADHNDGWNINNNEEAEATVTITGDADVTLGALDTSDTDVDGLTVNNTGTGTVSASVTANTADLTFSGSNIELTVDGSVDLSDDDLSAVTLLTLAEGATVELSQAQVDALGAANIVVANPTGAMETLNINAFGDGPFDATAFDADLDIATITMAAGDHTLNGDFTGVDMIVVQEGDTLNLTAAQYQQIVGVSGSKIVAFDTDGVDGTDPITVNITDLTQADIGASAFLSTGIALTNTVTLSLGEDVNLATADDIENIDTLIMADGQTLGLATQLQADDLVIDGGSNTTANLLFDITGAIDAIGYDITTLRALAVSVDGQDVEVLIDDLPNSVTLNLYEDSSQVGFVSDINRNVVIEAGVQVPSGDVIFNGEDPTREMRTLNITFEGDASDPLTDGNGNIFGSVINGSLVLDVEPAGTNLIADLFDTLTLISEGTGTSNAITGDISPLQADGLDAGNNLDNTLLNVVIQAESAFTIGGAVIFNSEDAAKDTATFSVSGPAPVSVGSLVVNPADVDIDTLVVNNAGGTLTVTGASPSIDAGTAETIEFNGDGDIVLGTAESTEDFADGITGVALSSIDASGLTGDLSIENISTDDTNLFAFTAGSGDTDVAITGQTLNDDGIASTTSGWTLDFSNAGVGSTLTLGANTYTDGVLDIDLGANTTLVINQDTDLTAMTLSITQTLDIVLADGAELTLTAAQADGLNIIGSGTVNVTELGTAPVDLSGIAAGIAGTTTLATDDVTLDAATDLGDFSVTLVDSDATAAALQGQTIRFQDDIQAARQIIIDNDGIAANLTDTGSAVDTNVVWLFDTITGSVDTSAYSGDLGRLWVTPELLANSNNVEELFTTLPDSIVRVEFSSLQELNFALSSADVDRVFEMVAFTDLSATGLAFSDEDRYENISSVSIQLGGQVQTGDIALDNVIAPSSNPLELDPANTDFNALVIESHLVTDDTHFLAPDGFVNDGDSINEQGEFALPNAINTVGDIGVGASNGVDLLTVTLDTKDLPSGTVPGAELVVGTITFDSEVAGATAIANITGENDITMKSLDTSDGDVSTLVINMAGFSGTFTVTGGSPAAAVVNTEVLEINNADAAAFFGTATDGSGEPYAGVAGDELSAITVSGGGTVDLGVIAQIDSNDDGVQDAFTLFGNGQGTAAPYTTAVIGTANVDGTLTAPTLDAGSTWNFNNANLTFSEDVALGAGTVNFDNVALTIDGNVNFTTLAELTVDAGDVTIEVPAGSTLTILAEDADGLTITGDGVVNIANLELTPDADLSNVMTDANDTGTVEAALDSTGDVELTGDLGIAHVTISGNGEVTVDNLATMADSTFTVGVGATLALHADQADGRVVDGAGTTNIEDIGLANYAGSNDVDYSTVASAQVNIAVNTDVTLNSDDDLGTAGANRVITINGGTTLTSAGSVVDEQFITGENATLLVDDENDGTGANDTAITADLSNVSAENITLVDDAIAGGITFPELYGDPAAWDAANTVPFQTVTMTAIQASGQTINGANGGTEGRVLVTDLGAAQVLLGGIDVGLAIADVPADVTLNPTTVLGEFSVELATDVDLTLTAAQADGRSITPDTAAAGTETVTVTDLEDTLGADLSAVEVDTETAQLDANGDVTLTANLGAGFTVEVSDSLAGGSNVMTFAGQMDSANTTFTIMSDDIELVFDADDAHELSVGETGGGAANSTVTVNNVDGDLMDLNGITADTMIANVPADAVMNAGTDFGNFQVRLAEGADLTLSFTQFLEVGADDAALDAGDFDSVAGGAEEIVTVTGFDPTTAINSSVVLPNLALKLEVSGAPAAQTVDAATDLTGVEEIVIPVGVTLTMTATQFQQIQTSATVTGAGTLNLTGFDNDNATIDLSSVTANAGTIELDPAAGATTITAGQLSGTPVIVDPTAILDNATGDQFGFVMTADNQGLTLSSETQADGRSVIEDGALTNTRLILGFDTPDATDADDNLVATNYAVDEVFVLNTYLAYQFGGVTPANIEAFLTDLDETIPVTVYDADNALTAGLVTPTAVDSVNRVITIEPNTFVVASVAFEDLRSGSEVVTLTLNMGGNSVIDGNLTLPQSEDPRDQLPNSFVQLFDSLTINSTDEVGALLSPNVIDGNIIGNTGLNGAESEVEIFTLTLDPGMLIVGNQDEIGFDGAVIGLDDLDDENAVATKLAGGSYENWVATASGNVVTFTNITAGDVTDVAIGDFTFLQNDGSTANFPGTSGVAVTQQGSFEASENNLLNVTIDADYDLDITGVLEFSYVSGTDSILAGADDVTAAANLTIDAAASVTVNIGSVNTSDTHITTLNYTKNGTGTVNAPGTSAGVQLGNTGTFNVNQPDGGTTTFGTAGDLGNPGVSGAGTTLINVDGQGTVNFNEIALVDGEDFTLDTTGHTGQVNAELRADLEDGGDWLFDNTGPGDLNLTIAGTNVVDAYPADAVYGASFGAGALEFINVDLTLEGIIDWSNLTSLTISGGTVTVASGSTLVLTVQQALLLDGAIVGEGTIKIVGDGTDANAATLGEDLQTKFIDLSDVTIDGTDADGELAIVLTGASGTATSGQDVTGSAFADDITTGDGNDTITSGLGDDSITAGLGTDEVYTGAGDDTIVGGDNDGIADGGADNDTLELSANYAPTGDLNLEGVENVVSDGTAKEIDLENQLGEAFNVTLGDGGDTVTTADGNDTITGGTGVDSIQAGAGEDLILGDSEDSLLDGGFDADILQVDATFDDSSDGQIIGIETVNAVTETTDVGASINLEQQTEDFVINGTDDDSDTVTAATGADTIVAGAGADTVNAGSGDDQITGGAGLDELNGGAGADTFNYGAGEFVGDETVSGGSEVDTVVLSDNETITDAEFTNKSGLEAITTGNGTNSLTLEANAAAATENLTVTGGTGVDTVDASALGEAVTINGGDGADILTGSALADSISGEVGNDSIVGGAGADTLLGGAGDDTIVGAQDDALLDGGADADVLEIGADFDDVSDAQIVGIETANLTADGLTVNLGDQTENLTINGFATGDSTITGGSGDDSITGGTGTDSLTGGAGVDTILAGAGDDTIVGAQDDALLDGGNDADVLEIGADFDDASNAQIVGIETANLTADGLTVNLGDQTENLTINGFATGDSTITGGTGDDSITGGTGTDSLTGGNGADTLVGGDNSDTLTGGAGVDSINAGNGDDVVNVNGTDDAGAETLVGGIGTDTLAVSSDLTLNASSELSGFETVTLTEASDLELAASELSDNSIATVTGTAGGVTETVTFVGTANAETIDLSGVTSVTDATLVVNAGAEDDEIIGSAFGDILNGEEGLDTITGGQGNDTMSGGTDEDTFVFISDANAETDTITDWGNGGNNDAVSGALGVGDQLNVIFAPWVPGAASATPSNTDATAGGDGVVNFATEYKVGDVITITFNGTDSVSRTVQAGGTSGVAVALSFQSIFESLSMGTSFDQDLVDGPGAAAVSSSVDGSAVLFITNDNGGDGAFTIDTSIVGATGYTFDASTIAATNGVVNVLGNDGDDTITGGVNADTIAGGTNDDVIIGGAGADVLSGDAGADSINGGSEADSIEGGAGEDTLLGGAGNDTIRGGDNNDTITGGAGSDELYGDAGDDVFIFADAAELAGDTVIDGGADTDTIQVLGTTLDDSFFDTVSNMEAIDFAGTSAHGLTLGANANTAFATGITVTTNLAATSLTVDGSSFTPSMDVTGTNNADTITGGSGDDIITGGAGSDEMTGNGGADTFVFALGDTGITVATADVINGFLTGVDNIDVGSLSPGSGDSYSEVDGTGRDEATFTSAANAAFNPTERDTYVEYNANSSGNAWAVTDLNSNGVLDAGDTFVVLVGVGAAGDVDGADFGY